MSATQAFNQINNKFNNTNNEATFLREGQNQSAIFNGRSGQKFRDILIKNLAAADSHYDQLNNQRFVDRRNSEEFLHNNNNVAASNRNQNTQEKPITSHVKIEQNKFSQSDQYTRRNRRQRRGSHDFQASRKIEIQDDKMQFNRRIDDRFLEESRFNKKAFEQNNSSDSQSYTDEVRSIDNSSDSGSYSAKRSQQSSQNLVNKKNDIESSSSNASSSKYSGKSSEKIFVPTFKCVTIIQDCDIDQKSQQSSDESTVSYGKKSVCRADTKVGLCHKRSHCKVSDEQNTQDSKKSTLIRSNRTVQRQPTVTEEEEIECADDKEGILLQQQLLDKPLQNKRKTKAMQKEMPEPKRMSKKNRSHNTRLYNGVDQDQDQDVIRDSYYYPYCGYSVDGKIPVQSPEILMNYGAIPIRSNCGGNNNNAGVAAAADAAAPAAPAPSSPSPLRPLRSSSSGSPSSESSHHHHHHEHEEHEPHSCCCHQGESRWQQRQQRQRQQQQQEFRRESFSSFSFRPSSSSSSSDNVVNVDARVVVSNNNVADLSTRFGQAVLTSTTTTPTTTVKTSPVKACGKVTNKQAYFQEILEKSKNLAKIFKGVVKTTNQFSICKGQFSIRFQCQNEHNFYLPADKIRDMDLNHIKTNYKNSRLEIERIFNEQGKVNSTEHVCQGEPSAYPLVKLDIDVSCWCIRCLDYYNHCLDTYNDNLLELVGGLFTKQVMYRCRSLGHIFYNRSVRKQKFQKQYRIQDLKCPECKKIQKENERKAAAEQEEYERKLAAEAQRELFEKTRIEMQKQEAEQHLYSRMQQQQQRVDQRKSLQQQEKALNEQAKKMSIEFLAQQNSQRNSFDSEDATNCSREGNIAGPSGQDGSGKRQASEDQVFLTYKFLITPFAMLVKGMAKKSEQDVKKYYHKIAIQLHPDKNCHPQAKEAFQKIENAVSEAKKMRNQRSNEDASPSFAYSNEYQQPNHNFGYYQQHRY